MNTVKGNDSCHRLRMMSHDEAGRELRRVADSGPKSLCYHPAAIGLFGPLR